MKRILSIVASGAVIAALSPGVASAASTYWVDAASPNCSDAGSGTSAAPFCDISAANKKAVAGDTVQVRPGDYREQVTAKNAGVRFVSTVKGGAHVLGSDDLSAN